MANIPQELINQIHQGQCVVFLGSDAPLGFAQGKAPPCRKELAQVLSKEMGMNTDLSLPNVAEEYEGKFGRSRLVKEIKNLLGKPSYKPHLLHHLITSLPVHAIITTNYDRLLEESLKERKRNFQLVVQDKEDIGWLRSQYLNQHL